MHHIFLSARTTSRWIACALILTFFTTAATMADNAESTSALGRYVKHLESEIPESMAAGDAEETRWLARHLRGLTTFARTQGAEDLLRRIEALELRLQTKVPADFQKRTSSTADKQGTIGGTVTRASTGEPLVEVFINLWHPDGFTVDSTFTGPTGAYSFANVPAGRYYVMTEDFRGFINELYDDIPCPLGLFFDCQLTDGTPIDVVDQGTAQIDFALDQGGMITGTVTDATTGETLSSIFVQALRADGERIADTFTDNQGNYRLFGLPTASYFVTTENFLGYRDEIYDNLPCPGGGFFCDLSLGTPVAVVEETTTSGIDFALDRLGRISGRVTDELSGDPIPFTDLEVYDSQGFLVATGFTDISGEYLVGGLETGTYFMSTRNNWNFDDELFDNLPCPNSACDRTTGTPIEVTLNETTPNIDFALAGGCIESQTVLCLNGDRFRVETTWRDFSDNSGKGQAVELTNDTGYFWFFSESNVEQVVKVLSACELPGFNNYWVFAGGLTSVEVAMTVTDIQTGEVKQYTNDLGVPFQPIQDTAAFSSCP